VLEALPSKSGIESSRSDGLGKDGEWSPI
jgi:hypothetical protein